MSGTAFKFVTGHFEGEPLESGNVKIKGKIGEGVQSWQDGRIFINSLDWGELIKLTRSLDFYVPKAIMPYIEVNNEEYGSETRWLTVMFLSIGIDLSSAKNEEGMNKI